MVIPLCCSSGLVFVDPSEFIMVKKFRTTWSRQQRPKYEQETGIRYLESLASVNLCHKFLNLASLLKRSCKGSRWVISYSGIGATHIHSWLQLFSKNWLILTMLPTGQSSMLEVTTHHQNSTLNWLNEQIFFFFQADNYVSEHGSWIQPGEDTAESVESILIRCGNRLGDVESEGILRIQSSILMADSSFIGPS
jgi:hypothetical protein